MTSFSRRSILLTALFGPALRRLRALPGPEAVTPWQEFKHPCRKTDWSVYVDMAAGPDSVLATVWTGDGGTIQRIIDLTPERKTYAIPIPEVGYPLGLRVSSIGDPRPFKLYSVKARFHDDPDAS